MLQAYVTKGYHSGGAAYVLSQESLYRFYQAQTAPKTPCLKDGGHEDIEISKCLRTQGVYPGKSLDEHNRELFHPLPFLFHYNGRFPPWMVTNAENPLQKVRQSFSFPCSSVRVSSRDTTVAVITAFRFTTSLPMISIWWIIFCTKFDRDQQCEMSVWRLSINREYSKIFLFLTFCNVKVIFRIMFGERWEN